MKRSHGSRTHLPALPIFCRRSGDIRLSRIHLLQQLTSCTETETSRSQNLRFWLSIAVFPRIPRVFKIVSRSGLFVVPCGYRRRLNSPLFVFERFQPALKDWNQLKLPKFLQPLWVQRLSENPSVVAIDVRVTYHHIIVSLIVVFRRSDPSFLPMAVRPSLTCFMVRP